MDYKKKYKEALERAKGIHSFSSDIAEIKRMEQIFPELAESEDERIRKNCIHFLELQKSHHAATFEIEECIAWLEKQVGCELDCPQNHQDSSHPNGCIVLEDFTGGEGFYKVHLDYLNKKQVEEVEEMIRAWNTELKTPNENIKACIGMALTDVPETRFKSYGVSLKECLAWLEKQNHDGKKWIYEDVYHKEKEQLIQEVIDEVLENPQKYGLEKQGEQDDYDDNIITRDDEILQAISVGLTDVVKDAGWSDFGGIPIKDIQAWLEKQTPKPKWTDEDEELLQHCCGAVAAADYYTLEDKEEMENWLESLKQRML